jgi:glycosyltransferase involved in cell wall biosynthesis
MKKIHKGMPTKPVVSVILPAFNAETYLSVAIESILNQTFEELELIVVDDYSTDNTWKIIKQFARRDPRVVALRNEHNVKLSETLNAGIAVAKGKYIARMDADDWSYPDRLTKQVEYLETHPEVGVCGGTMEVCNQDLKVLTIRRYHLTDEEIRKHLFRYSPFSHPLIMMRKEVLDQVGGYRGQFNPAEDYELYFRIGKVAKFGNIRDLLLKYRIIPKSMTTGGTRKMEQKTIAIRYLYAKDYGMTWLDHVYTWIHQLSLFIVPSSWKIWVFNILRNKLVK